MTVSNYIRELLYTEDLVIVPGFGGFIGNYKEAKINFQTNAIFPPSKVIAFNQKLQNNDGLLIETIASGENISYETAKQKVDDFVKKLNIALNKGKTVKLKSLGSFSKKKSLLVFNPDADANYLRSTFGLDSFEFPMLETSSKRKTQPNKTMTPVRKKHRRPNLVPLIAGIPIIAALIYAPFFFQDKEYQHVFGKAGIEIPMGLNKRIIALNAADFDLERKALHVKPETTKKIDAANTTKNLDPSKTEKKLEPVESKKAETKPVSEPKVADTKTTQGNYFTIGGSFSSMANAEKAVSQYESMGYSCRIFNAGNGMHRVAIKSYETLESASQELEHLRQSVGNDNLWILRR